MAFPSAMGRPPVVNFDLSGLVTEGRYDRFIIHFHASSQERDSPAATVRYAKEVARRTGLMTPRLPSSAMRAPLLRINFQRALATDGMLITTSWRLDVVEARTFIQALAAHRQVAYVEPDLPLPMIDGIPRSLGPEERALDEGTRHRWSHAVTWACVDILSPGSAMREVNGSTESATDHSFDRCSNYVSDLTDAIVWASGGHVDGMADALSPTRRIHFSWHKAGICSATSALGLAIARATANGSVVVVDRRVVGVSPPSAMCSAGSMGEGSEA